MLAPDGTPGEVPVEQVQSAVSKGFKLGMPMTAPDGTIGTIPVDRAHDAIKGGFKPQVTVKPVGSEPLFNGPVAQKFGAVGEGGAEAAGDIWGALKSAATSPTPGSPLALASQVEQVLPLFNSYEKARSSGSSVVDSLKAASDTAVQHVKNIVPLKAAVAAYHENPTRFTARAVTDAVALATSFLGGDAAGAPEAAAPEAEAATGAVADSPSWLQSMNPFRAKAAVTPSPVPAGTAAGDAASIVDEAEPLDVKATQATRKVGLPEGRTATSDVETQQALADQAKTQVANQAEAGKQVQANLQTGLRETWNNVADDNGVPRSAANVSIREAGQQVGDSIYARSKASYKLIDDATDGEFQPNADALKNVNLKLRDIAGTDDAAEAKLMAQKQRLEWQQDQLFDQAADNGVSKDTVQSAKNDFHKAQAIYDTNHQIRMTTTGLPPEVAGALDNPEVVKSGNLMNRLVKDYSPEEGGKPGRLVQAVGDENAHSMLSHTSAAQVAENKLLATVIDNNPDFSALPATESKALREIIRPNVKAGKVYGTNVNWKGALDDFDKLTPQEQNARFSNPGAVRQSLRSQATLHNIKLGAKVGTGLGSAGLVEETIRQNLP
jgi:hypothetical protein